MQLFTFDLKLWRKITDNASLYNDLCCFCAVQIKSINPAITPCIDVTKMNNF